MALTREERQLLNETHDTVIRIGSIVYGTPGTADEGMVGEMKGLRNSHFKLRRHFWTLVGVLVGSGVLGGSAAALLKALGG
jgi:hypothetical protein|tara:strand:- start:8210 stop:8452 length:243 start_codon:yes stop_codon:yes gene_type:complete